MQCFLLAPHKIKQKCFLHVETSKTLDSDGNKESLGSRSQEEIKARMSFTEKMNDKKIASSGKWTKQSLRLNSNVKVTIKDEVWHLPALYQLIQCSIQILIQFIKEVIFSLFSLKWLNRRWLHTLMRGRTTEHHSHWRAEWTEGLKMSEGCDKDKRKKHKSRFLDSQNWKVLELKFILMRPASDQLE